MRCTTAPLTPWPSTDQAALARINCPVLGLYGQDDARLTSTVEATGSAIRQLEKTLTARVYAGAGHGFPRQQSGRDGANRGASEQAWSSTIAFLREKLDRRSARRAP